MEKAFYVSAEERALMGKAEDAFPVRISDRLMERIAETAKQNGRAINSEILKTLTSVYLNEEYPAPHRAD